MAKTRKGRKRGAEDAPAGKREGGEKRGSVRPWRVFTENLECLAIAIVMALILNTFFIQAYKIPTGSMQPTLIGCSERGIFDRVLVDKCIYLFGPPRRWDVVVFKFPLDQSKNYIKRLVGLPGEKIEIRKGDVYVNGKVARKPEATLDAVLKEIYPATGEGGRTFSSFFRTVRGRCTAQDKGSLRFEGPAEVETARPIVDGYLDGYDPDYHISAIGVPVHHAVGDLRLSFTVRLAENAEGVYGRISEGGWVHAFHLRGPKGREPTALRHGALRDGIDPPAVWKAPDLVLEAGRDYAVSFTHADDRISLRLDGEEIGAFEYTDTEPDQKIPSKVAFGIAGGGGDMEALRLFRDIYYLPGRFGASDFEVLPGHYFVLGDNTQNSWDSRFWKVAVFRTKDGREVMGNYDDSPETLPRRTGGGYLFRDIYGDERFLPLSEIVTSSEGKYYEIRSAHFVPERLLLGKAMLVFWPIYPHFRWKLLR